MTKGKVGEGVGCVSVLVVSQPSLRYEGLRVFEMFGVLHRRCSTSYKVSSFRNLTEYSFYKAL